VAVEIEVDPFRGAAPLGTAEHVAVEMPRFLEVADLHRHVKRGERHVVTACYGSEVCGCESLC
jgi:hypothetical protein